MQSPFSSPRWTPAIPSLLHAQIMESQNHLGWKKPLSSLNPDFDWSPHCHLNQSTQYHIQKFLECFQGWSLHLSPGKSIPMFKNPLHEKIPPDVQFEPPWCSLRLFPLTTGCLGEEAAFYCQGFVQSQKVPPEPLFPQAEHPQLLQLLLMVQTLHQLHSHLWTGFRPSMSWQKGPRTTQDLSCSLASVPCRGRCTPPASAIRRNP